MPQLPRRLGRYEIEAALAHGGMAELFVARVAGPEGFAKRVVVKRVLPALARDPAFVEMFLHEARLAATLEHRNIVAVHDIGRDEAGFFFAMELLHGADVGALLRATDAALPLALALDIACGACAGLHHAHERQAADGSPLGLVHRDVSPQNLFVTFDGATKLLDFGIAKAVDQIADRATRTGTLRGKVPYMSPEQCRAEPLDRRSDIFSLGIVLWELCAGERLFGANGEGDFEVFKQIAERDAPAITTRRPDCPDELARIIARALARDRAARFQTMAELHDALEAVIRGRSLAISPREVGGFLAQRFPARAEAWRRGELAAEPAGAPSAAPPAVRATVELPASPADDGDSAPPAPAPPASASVPTSDTPPPAASAPTSDAPSPAPATPARSPRRLAVAGLAVGGLALAILIGFWAGRGTGAATTATASPAGSASVASVAPPGTPPGREDRHGFQPDDYLISATPYRDGRLDGLRVAKLLAPLDPATGLGRFLDGSAHESTTAAHWKSRIARPDELQIGTLAACRAEPWELASAGPADREDARTHSWMLARVTDLGGRAAGRVSVGDVVCDLAGVRVVE